MQLHEFTVELTFISGKCIMRALFTDMCTHVVLKGNWPISQPVLDTTNTVQGLVFLLNDKFITEVQHKISATPKSTMSESTQSDA